MSEPINRTPAHLRCPGYACPSIHQLEDGRLVIVGKRDIDLVYSQGIPRGDDEAVILIDLALLSDIKHLIP